MMRFFRSLAALVVAFVLVTGQAPAQAQDEGEARLGGGSDISSEDTVVLPQGGRLPPIHLIFADNPADSPIEVEFRAEVPIGITIEPEWETKAIPANGRVDNYFAVSVAPAMADGKYSVVVQLVRSDIDPVPGQITNIPAIQTAFTVHVTGESATVTVRSVSALTGQPVLGTITLGSDLSGGRRFEINRAEGSVMETHVAPGDYRAAFLLGGREIAAEDITVEENQETEVVLEVETISFVLATIRPAEENGRIVVVDLAASVNNEAGPIPGPAALRAMVIHNSTEIDLVTLKELDVLPVGITEATATYRPQDGWQPGVYEFAFELSTPTFTLIAPDRPSLDVPDETGFKLGDFFTSLDVRRSIALAAGLLLLLVLLERLIRAILGRRRRSSAVAEPPPPESLPAAIASDSVDSTYRPRHANVER